MKKKIFVLLVMLVFSVLLTSCDVEVARDQVSSERFVEDSSQFVGYYQMENGNSTYINIDMEGNIEDHMDVVLGSISEWESNNPDRELIHFQVIYDSDVYIHDPWIHGILIYSQPIEVE